MDDNQVYEVGTLHGFYFKEFTQNTDCPITEYRITIVTNQNTDHTSFKERENVYPTRQIKQGDPLMLMEAEVFDTSIEATYSFRIEATALGGSKRWTNTKTLQYKCLDNVFIQQPFDFNPNYFSYIQAPGSKKRYDFSRFTTYHYLCPIEKYVLDNNADNTNINSPTRAVLDPTCI